MDSFVTLTYDPAAGTTTVIEPGRPAWTSREPAGIVGLCRTGSLYLSCGSTVTYRLRRADGAKAGR